MSLVDYLLGSGDYRVRLTGYRAAPVPETMASTAQGKATGSVQTARTTITPVAQNVGDASCGSSQCAEDETGIPLAAKALIKKASSHDMPPQKRGERGGSKGKRRLDIDSANCVDLKWRYPPVDPVIRQAEFRVKTVPLSLHFVPERLTTH